MAGQLTFMRDCRRADTARNRAVSTAAPAIAALQASRYNLLGRWADLVGGGDEDVVRPEAEVDGRRALERADEEPGSHQQHDGERSLHHHQGSAQHSSPSTPRARPRLE